MTNENRKILKQAQRPKHIHALGIFCLIAILLTLAPPTLAADSQLFFRWGAYDTNKTILEKGGYPGDTNGHDQGLSQGISARFTTELYQQLADWNKASSDVAGTGLYASKDPFDSIQFGGTHPSLLIVEIFNPELMKAYTGNWYVATQVTSEILIRPPNATDVDRIWAMWTSETRLYNLIQSVCTHLFKSYEDKKWPRSTQIFFERIIFDKAADFVAKKIQEPNQNLSSNNQQMLKYLTLLLLHQTPQHPALNALIPHFFKSTDSKAINSAIGFSSKAAIALWSRLGSDSNATFYQALRYAVSHESSALPSILEIIIYGMSRLSLEEIDSLKTALTVKMQKPAFGAYSAEFLVNLEKVLGPEQKKLYQRAYKKYSLNTLINPSALFMATGSQDFNTVLKKNKDYVFDLAKLHDPDIFVAAADQIKNLSAESLYPEHADIYFLLKSAVLQYGVSTESAKPAEEFFAAFDEKFGQMVKVSESSTSRQKFFRRFLFKAIEINDSPEFLQSLVKNLVKASPTSVSILEKQLHHMMISPLYSNSPFRLSIADTLSDLRQASNTKQLIQKNKDYAAQVVIPPSAKDPKTNINWENIYSTVGDSLEYSRISRIFSLVDPLLVSEDLRMMNAQMPWLRFNEAYHLNGKNYQQPAWNNFIHVWENNTDNGAVSLIMKSNSAAYHIGLSLLSGFVDGQGNPLNPNDDDIDLSYRNQLRLRISKSDWDKFVNVEMATELKTFFSFEISDSEVILKFKNISQVTRQLGYNPAGQVSNKLIDYVMFLTDKINAIENPIDKAVEILYLVPKVHPFNNGNGRLARFWATAVLMAAGYAPPVGLPTNDFLISKERLHLEVRKSVALGRLWKEMLSKAEKNHVPVNEFFQKIYRGSALEGLILYNPASESDLKNWVLQLETMNKAPDWATSFNQDIENKIREIHSRGGNIANTSELEQFKLLTVASAHYPVAQVPVSKNAGAVRCEVLYSTHSY